VHGSRAWAGRPLAGAIPRFFLSESDERKACEREIGPIGRLRQSFKQLDRLMAAQAEPKWGRDSTCQPSTASSSPSTTSIGCARSRR
jgi:hypothetical protein